MHARRIRGAGLVCWLTAAATLFGRAVAGASVSVHPSADTSISASFAGNNLGGNSNLIAGSNGGGLPARALLRFDLASVVPGNAVVRAASLNMKVTIIPGGGGADSKFDLRRLLVDWGEGAGSGNTGRAATAGEATWTDRFFPDQKWSAPGGLAGPDFSESASTSTLVGGIGSFTFAPTPQLVSDVRSWLENPNDNFGWMVMSESEEISFTARRFGAREDLANAPTLTIEYAVAPVVEEMAVAGGKAQFSFMAADGESYVVQFCESLNESKWQTLTTVPAQAARKVLIADDVTPERNRFYRIAIL